MLLRLFQIIFLGHKLLFPPTTSFFFHLVDNSKVYLRMESKGPTPKEQKRKRKQPLHAFRFSFAFPTKQTVTNMHVDKIAMSVAVQKKKLKKSIHIQTPTVTFP